MLWKLSDSIILLYFQQFQSAWLEPFTRGKEGDGIPTHTQARTRTGLYPRTEQNRGHQ